MTISEARGIVNRFDENKVMTEDEIFMFTEAMNYLIDELHNPHDMMRLGGYYYELRNFDLALKYYEMAATYDFDDAYECLGYIWYYGRTGEVNYEKAFYYFSKMMDKGNPVATYKVADMYKNGYFVQKDESKYEEIIEKLYIEAADWDNVFDPIPEVFTRLARIRKKQNETEEAINLYLYAKRVLAIRIGFNAFFGNLNIMKWLVEDLYELLDFDYDDFDLFDLYFLLKTPHEIEFEYDGVTKQVKSVIEDGELHVCFEEQWYRTIDDFFRKAEIDGRLLTSLYKELYSFEVTQ